MSTAASSLTTLPDDDVSMSLALEASAERQRRVSPSSTLIT